MSSEAERAVAASAPAPQCRMSQGLLATQVNRECTFGNKLDNYRIINKLFSAHPVLGGGGRLAERAY